MASLVRASRDRWIAAIAGVWLVVAAGGWSVLRAQVPAAEGPGGGAASDARKTAELFRALQELSGVVERERLAGAGLSAEEVLKNAGRPVRTVETPTLTSEQIDAMIDRTLAAEKAPKARLTTDEEFLRRVCLDLTGKLPTAELKTALGRGKERDRAQLIDRLLDDPAFGENLARYWRDVILYRATNPTIRRYGVERLEGWLADQFNANRPWDEVAGELITASGSTEEAGPPLFQLAHADQNRVQPVEVAGEVSRIFMGVQIQCAQCHDHPTDPWTREQFHQLAAFFSGTTARPNGQPAGRNGFTIVSAAGSPRYTMPDLEDPEKSIPVAPAFFLAGSEQAAGAGLTGEQRRALAASYVTGQDNPWFSRSFVNRVCYTLLGQAFYSPVDDLGPAREPEQGELLDALAGQFTASGYDVKWLYRTLLNTAAYQRAARDTNSEAGLAAMASNVSSRLRSDQIADSLAQVLGMPGGAMGGMRRPGAGAGAMAARANPRALFNFIFGIDPSTPNEEVLGTIPQSLLLMNSAGINQAITARPGSTLGRLLSGHPRDADAVAALYQQVLVRNPTAREQEVALAYIGRVSDRREAFEDLFWSLLNSTEFISRK